MLVLYFTAVVFLIYFVIQYSWKRGALYKFASTYPGLSGTLPYIGDGLFFWKIKPADTLERLDILFGKFQSGFRFWLGPNFFVLVKSPDHVQQIFTSRKTQDKAYFYDCLKWGFGDGIILSNGKKWKSHRKIINIAMSRSNLQNFVDTYSEHSRVLVDKLKPHVDQPAFNIFNYVGHCATDIVCETIMGASSSVEVERNEELQRNIDQLFRTCIARMYQFWLRYNIIFKHSKYYQTAKAAKEGIHNFLGEIIKAKIKIYENSKIEELGNFSILEKLIGLVWEKREMNEEELYDEILNLFIASKDPISVIASSVLFMLGIKQDIQDKVVMEMKSIFKDSTRPVQFEDLHKMRYLEMVIKEANRLYPVTMFCRGVTEDFQLDDKVIPKGASIAVTPYITHRLKEHWGDNPDVFDPDNFLPERVANRHPYAYIAFSGGFRSCPGKDYGMMTLKTLITEVLRKYVIITDKKEEEIRLLSGMTVRPNGEFQVRIKERIY